jgi:integrase
LKNQVVGQHLKELHMPRTKAKNRDGIYTRPDRPGFWGSWTDAPGRRQFKVATLQQAQAVLAAERLKVEEAIKFGKPLPSKDSFSVFADEFLKFQEKRIAPRVAKGKLSQAEYTRQEGILKQHLKPHFGDMKLAGIRKSDVLAYIHNRTGNVSDATIIKEVNVLKRMLNLALDLEKIPTNPAQRAPLPQAPEGRNRWLTNDELHKVLKACYIAPTEEQEKNGVEPDQWLQNAAGLAVALGTRRGELLNVTLSDINLDAGTILLRRTKNGRPRSGRLNELAVQVLESMGIRELKRKRNRGLLFPDVTPAQVSVRFIRACEDAGVEDFSFHDLRHTYASHLRMNGADLHDIQKMLGHSDPRMTNRYAHLSDEHLDKTAQRLNGVLTLPAQSDKAASEELTEN